MRLGRCNLDCAWCDTPFTWDWSGKNGTVYDPAVELTTLEVDQIVDRVGEIGAPLLVISGGEPMLQRRGLTALIAGLSELTSPPAIEIETNGTQAPWDELYPARFNVSPKLTSSGVTRDRAWRPEVIAAFNRTGRATFKFVAGTDADFDDIQFFVALMHLDPSTVWIMRQTEYGAVAPEVLSRTVAEWAIEHGFNYTPRLQVQLWGQERGR